MEEVSVRGLVEIERRSVSSVVDLGSAALEVGMGGQQGTSCECPRD